MTIRDEGEAIGFAFAALGVTFAGTLTALFTMTVPYGFYPIATSPAGPLWAAVFPAAFVGVFARLLRGHRAARLHPIPIVASAFVGGVLSFFLFQPFGLTSILFLPALLVFPAALLSGFALDRPTLSLGAIGLHAFASMALYSVFALPQLAVALRWIDLTGCDGCDPADASIAAVVLFALGLSVLFGAALRYRPFWQRARGPARPGDTAR